MTYTPDTPQSNVKSIRKSLMTQLNLREGDNYELTMADGSVISAVLTEVIWVGIEIIAIRIDSPYIIPKPKVPGADQVRIKTESKRTIPWHAIDTFTWHAHWQEGFVEEKY